VISSRGRPLSARQICGSLPGAGVTSAHLHVHRRRVGLTRLAFDGDQRHDLGVVARLDHSIWKYMSKAGRRVKAIDREGDEMLRVYAVSPSTATSELRL
jgi:hypothetical protein